MSEIVGKKIKALPEATTAADTDVMVIEDGSKTRKIGFGVLRRLLGIDTINNNLSTEISTLGSRVTSVEKIVVAASYISGTGANYADTQTISGYVAGRPAIVMLQTSSDFYATAVTGGVAGKVRVMLNKVLPSGTNIECLVIFKKS